MEKTQEIDSTLLNKASELIKHYNNMLNFGSNVTFFNLKNEICEYHSKHKNEYIEYLPNAYALNFTITVNTIEFHITLWDFSKCKGKSCVNLCCPIIEEDGSKIAINAEISNNFMEKKFFKMLHRNFRRTLTDGMINEFNNRFSYDERKRFFDAFKADTEDITLNIMDNIEKYTFIKLCEEYLSDDDKLSVIAFMFVGYYTEKEEEMRHIYDKFDAGE